jgi:hypothetical protein
MKTPFREVANAQFQLSVVQEYIDGMPVVELHRNHGIPLSAVKKWISAYKLGGKRAVIEQAAEMKVLLQKPITAAQRKSILADLVSKDSDKQRNALILVALHQLNELVPNLMNCLKGPATIEAILTLKALGVSKELKVAKSQLGRNYAHWF